MFAIFTAVLDYIENRISGDISDDEVAEIAGFSTSHFRVLFREATGETLASYIRKRKLSHAAFKLINTDKNIVDIAFAYGFNSHDSFTRAFRREFNITPAKFRTNKNYVKSKVIVPGIYGPTIIINRELISNKNSSDNSHNSSLLENYLPDNIEIKQRDSTILYGVPAFGEGECTPFIASLRSCLSYLGQRVSYARLMTGSGAAFRTVWKRNCWYEGNVDIMDLYDDPTIPIKQALNTVGRNFTLLSKPGGFGYQESEIKQKDKNKFRIGVKKDFRNMIKKEIDSGRPLIAFGIIGPPEACIITGYKEDVEVLTGWNIFQNMPKYAGDLEKEPCGYFQRRNWYEHSGTIAIMAVGEKLYNFNEKAQVKMNLKEAVNIMQGYQSKDYARGFAAFQAWRKGLLDDRQFPENAALLQLIERVICHLDLCTMIGEGRWNAHLYFEDISGLFPRLKQELIQISSLFKEEKQCIDRMFKVLGGYGMGEKEAKTLAKKEVRVEMGSLISKLLELDRKAVVKLTGVLEII